MDARGIGILLLWASALPALAVLIVRIRAGMWRAASMEATPPVSAGQKGLAALALILMLAGAGLVLGSFL